MRLHVIDGTFELFRAHYSRRPTRSAPDGMDVKGTLGVVSSLLGLLADPEEAVTHIAVAFDNPIESFRNELFAGYKTGAGMDPALVAQMDLVEEAVATIGIVVWSMDEYEADDALATAAKRWGDGVDQVRIMTPDKDLGQSVVGQRIVQVDRMRRKVIDADGVREKNGVDPECIPDWLALVGDTADGIPGVPGFGAKTAAAPPQPLWLRGRDSTLCLRLARRRPRRPAAGEDAERASRGSGAVSTLGDARRRRAARATVGGFGMAGRRPRGVRRAHGTSGRHRYAAEALAVARTGSEGGQNGFPAPIAKPDSGVLRRRQANARPFRASESQLRCQ